MEEPTDFQDWEFLQSSDSDNNSIAFGELDPDSADGPIKSDYFALDSKKPYPMEEDLSNSENPCWVDPSSNSSYLNRPKDELGIKEIEFLHEDPEEFLPESEKGNSFHVDDSKLEVGFEGIEATLETFDVAGDGKELGFGGIEKSEGSECGDEKPEELGSDSSVEISNSENVSIDEGEKKVLVWWKLPLELLNFCVFRVRPVWSIPIAAAVIGIVMMGRRLYKMKHRTRRIPLKISIDDKKVISQFLVRAARLNEAVVRRVPPIRSPLISAGVVTPWPVVGLL